MAEERKDKRGYSKGAALNKATNLCFRCQSRFGPGEYCQECGIHRDRKVGRA